MTTHDRAMTNITRTQQLTTGPWQTWKEHGNGQMILSVWMTTQCWVRSTLKPILTSNSRPKHWNNLKSYGKTACQSTLWPLIVEEFEGGKYHEILYIFENQLIVQYNESPDDLTSSLTSMYLTHHSCKGMNPMSASVMQTIILLKELTGQIHLTHSTDGWVWR